LFYPSTNQSYHPVSVSPNTAQPSRTNAQIFGSESTADKESALCQPGIAERTVAELCPDAAVFSLQLSDQGNIRPGEASTHNTVLSLSEKATGEKTCAEFGSTAIQVLPNNVDMPRSRALFDVLVPRVSSGLPSGELELMDYAEPISSQPLTCLSGKIKSAEYATLVVLPESIGQVVPPEEPGNRNRSETSGACVSGDTRIHQDFVVACRPCQESTVSSAGKIFDSRGFHMR
jgi:hypothetical protein